MFSRSGGSTAGDITINLLKEVATKQMASTSGCEGHCGALTTNSCRMDQLAHSRSHERGCRLLMKSAIVLTVCHGSAMRVCFEWDRHLWLLPCELSYGRQFDKKKCFYFFYTHTQKWVTGAVKANISNLSVKFIGSLKRILLICRMRCSYQHPLCKDNVCL